MKVEGRTIKFRAWDNFNKRMLGPFGPFAHNDEYNLLYLEGDLDVPARDNLNFMQFTGLKDKNDKEIYEGDIVKIAKYVKEPWIVGWNLAEGRWCFVYDTGEPARGIGAAEVKRLEVLGNIYENPELLK